MPYGPDASGLYMNNEIWSPFVANAGAGSQYRLSLLTYRDLPLDNLQFYIWSIRTQDAAGCPTTWDNFNFVYYGGQKDWIRTAWEVGSLVPGTATDVQASIGAVDMCTFWCGVYGTGACHSHAPVIDQVRLVRVDSHWDRSGMFVILICSMTTSPKMASDHHWICPLRHGTGRAAGGQPGDPSW